MSISCRAIYSNRNMQNSSQHNSQTVQSAAASRRTVVAPGASERPPEPSDSNCIIVGEVTQSTPVHFGHANSEQERREPQVPAYGTVRRQEHWGSSDEELPDITWEAPPQSAVEAPAQQQSLPRRSGGNGRRLVRRAPVQSSASPIRINRPVQLSVAREEVATSSAQNQENRVAQKRTLDATTFKPGDIFWMYEGAPEISKRRLDDLKKTLEENKCPICADVYSEPIFMKCCKQTICARDLELLFNQGILSCPFCRENVGSWLELVAGKKNEFVCNALEKNIKALESSKCLGIFLFVCVFKFFLFFLEIAAWELAQRIANDLAVLANFNF